MSEEYNIDMLRQLLKYNPTTGEVLWGERDESFYPNSINPTASVNVFNRNYAGQPASINVSSSGNKTILLRSISQTARVSYDKVLWLTISGYLTDHPILRLDGNPDNDRLENLVLMPAQAKQTKLQPFVGISEYETSKGMMYRVRIIPEGGKPVQKTGFTTKEEAQAWRIQVLRDNNLWWAIKATQAYKENPYREQQAS